MNLNVHFFAKETEILLEFSIENEIWLRISLCTTAISNSGQDIHTGQDTK